MAHLCLRLRLALARERKIVVVVLGTLHKTGVGVPALRVRTGVAFCRAPFPETREQELGTACQPHRRRRRRAGWGAAGAQRYVYGTAPPSHRPRCAHTRWGRTTARSTLPGARLWQKHTHNYTTPPKTHSCARSLVRSPAARRGLSEPSAKPLAQALAPKPRAHNKPAYPRRIPDPGKRATRTRSRAACRRQMSRRRATARPPRSP